MNKLFEGIEYIPGFEDGYKASAICMASPSRPQPDADCCDELDCNCGD